MESASWYETNVELTKGLLSFAAGCEIKPKYVVFDSWYAAAVVLNLLVDLEWSYVAQIAHLHLGCIALCLTQHAAYSQKQTIYAFKRELFRQPIPTHLPLINDSLEAA